MDPISQKLIKEFLRDIEDIEYKFKIIIITEKEKWKRRLEL